MSEGGKNRWTPLDRSRERTGAAPPAGEAAARAEVDERRTSLDDVAQRAEADRERLVAALETRLRDGAIEIEREGKSRTARALEQARASATQAAHDAVAKQLDSLREDLTTRLERGLETLEKRVLAATDSRIDDLERRATSEEKKRLRERRKRAEAAERAAREQGETTLSELADLSEQERKRMIAAADDQLEERVAERMRDVELSVDRFAAQIQEATTEAVREATAEGQARAEAELERGVEARVAEIDRLLAERGADLRRIGEELSASLEAHRDRALADLGAELERPLAEAKARLLATADDVAAELAGSLVTQAEALGRGARQLAASFEGNASSRRDEWARERARAEESGDEADGSGARSIPEGLRIIIAQMAAEGRTRGEIAELLKSDFGMRDSTAIVATVLGSGSSSGPS